MGSTRNRSRSPAPCPYEATWRKQKMQELGVRWALRQHIKSFHALENVRSSFDGLVRRYSKKTQKWAASGNTESILQHAAHVAAWVVFGDGMSKGWARGGDIYQKLSGVKVFLSAYGYLCYETGLVEWFRAPRLRIPKIEPMASRLRNACNDFLGADLMGIVLFNALYCCESNLWRVSFPFFVDRVKSMCLCLILIIGDHDFEYSTEDRLATCMRLLCEMLLAGRRERALPGRLYDALKFVRITCLHYPDKLWANRCASEVEQSMSGHRLVVGDSDSD